MEAGEEEDVQERPGDKHSGNIASQLEWCSQSGRLPESVEKFRLPMLQQEWEDLSLSRPKS